MRIYGREARREAERPDGKMLWRQMRDYRTQSRTLAEKGWVRSGWILCIF